MMPKKALEKEDKEKEGKQPDSLLDCRCNFTSLVYYSGRIYHTDDLVPQRRLVSHLSFKLKRE